jgi:hypothetical protein
MRRRREKDCRGRKRYDIAIHSAAGEVKMTTVPEVPLPPQIPPPPQAITVGQWQMSRDGLHRLWQGPRFEVKKGVATGLHGLQDASGVVTEQKISCGDLHLDLGEAKLLRDALIRIISVVEAHER